MTDRDRRSAGASPSGMRGPLRLARLLLVGAAAASAGVAVFIAAATSEPSRAAPVLVVLVAVAGLFLAARARLATDVVAARLYAVSGASAMAGLGVLTGFGAGVLSFPAAALGILAAASTVASARGRRFAVGVVLYLVAGLAFALGTPFSFFSAFTILLWPLLATLSPSGAGSIFGALGVAAGLAALALARDRGVPLWLLRPRPFGFVVALAGGVLALAVDVASADLDVSSSARFELVPIALAVVFVAGAGAGLGLASLRDAPPLAALGIALAVSLGLFVIVSGPAVRCATNGVSTSAGPWWLGEPRGGLSSSGGSGAGGTGVSRGEIRRGDGVVVRYACEGARLAEFVVER